MDTDRLDQVLNLSGEIGLTKNRLTHLRSDILQGRSDAVTRTLDESVSQLDMLVVNLQNAVMKTRIQPIGRLFNKYPRLALILLPGFSTKDEISSVSGRG